MSRGAAARGGERCASCCARSTARTCGAVSGRAAHRRRRRRAGRLPAWLQRRANVDDPPVGVAIPPDARNGAADDVADAVGPFTASAILRVTIETAMPSPSRSTASPRRAARCPWPFVDREELVRALAAGAGNARPH